MDVDQTTESGVLRGRRLCSDRLGYRAMLGTIYQSVAQPAVGVFGIWITDAQRQVISTAVVLYEDVELAFGRCAITFPYLVRLLD